MKTKNIFLLTCGLLLSVWSHAQTQPTELNTTPPAQTDVAAPKRAENQPTELPAAPRKMQYGVSVGSMFTNGFGSATYFQPSIIMPISKRFSAFGSVGVITQYGNTFGQNSFENQFSGASNFSRSHYLVSAGGNYLVNNRLNVTGSVWRDFSKQNMLPNAPLTIFGARGTSGLQFRANYKITENFSVSGGFRYSNGNTFNTLYQPQLDPFGF